MQAVAAFTDTYLPTVNGVSYTISTWRDRWTRRGGRMDVVFPKTNGYAPSTGEHPVGSLPFPFYDGFRLALPRIPNDVNAFDVVHAHTPFSLGLAALWLARRQSIPLVASYHTPITEYAEYVSLHPAMTGAIKSASERWARWFLNHADLVMVPSEPTREHLRQDIRVSSPIRVMPNGIDTDRFRPVDPGDFLETNGLPTDRPLVGYTGRHGYEKQLEDLVDAVSAIDVTLVLGGDGPARPELERRAADRGVDARFLGFLDRADLPAFYSALDVFGFPSPVETQGLVALESIACGTPVVGVNAGALAETIDVDTTGYHFDDGDIHGFRDGIKRALTDRDRLRACCIEARGDITVEHTVDRLETEYSLI